MMSRNLHPDTVAIHGNLDPGLSVGSAMLPMYPTTTYVFPSAQDGEQAFCDKFTDEIMITGYFILAFLLSIGGTSYFRHSIPYELFYAIHHLVFIMYAVAVAHTFDSVQRNDQRNRSQTFRWFSVTM